MSNILAHFHNCVYSRTAFMVRDNYLTFIQSPRVLYKKLQLDTTDLNNITKHFFQFKLCGYKAVDLLLLHCLSENIFPSKQKINQ